MNHIICYVPIQSGKVINEKTWGLYHFAKKIAQLEHSRFLAIVVHSGLEEKTLLELPFDEVYHVKLEEEQWHLVEAHIQAFERIYQELSAIQGMCLFSSGYLYHDIATSLSDKHKSDISIKVLEVKQIGDGPKNYMVRRSLYNEKIQEWITLSPEINFQYVTIDQAILYGEKENGQRPRLKGIHFKFENDRKIKFVKSSKMSLEELKITEARCVIGIGRGVSGCNQEELNLIMKLAEILNAPIGGSKVADELGLIPRENRIGASGSNIEADIYIAIGISGSTQHLEGIRGVKNVIAINDDASAPIFNRCDIGIVGDFREGVKMLVESFEMERRYQEAYA
ncbi:electron transfer flavoprotein subunit alpha/FixB family protein [Bacillus salipaludis]|uniref:Electron transfer flavoprotein subunit alpha/FixB family protein n=1 Tax=Bacillus salipaludis TaxID=2547811 RepID=A0A4R5VXU1_9BACI|nr:FAD-binding protein [Bacillus salipaludis]MDQ6594914.1 FAD-binding protein [Bacillus salipaludis]TDK64205.1 electron transfer flavoprotein subunit alpha/FixB family protein [Bacillus salipaludis]